MTRPPVGSAPAKVDSSVVSGSRRALVAGTGLIGGSVGMALRRAGWHVTGIDTDPSRADEALRLGAVDRIGLPEPCDLGVVATPVGSVAAVAQQLLDSGAAVVTDVGSVKGPVTEAVTAANFVAGHPMAGNEQEGLEGADPDMFEGALWVLTPTANTADGALTRVREVVTGFGAQAISLDPHRHDALVAVVSHVPHLAAATLMRIAHRRSSEHRAVLRLAAGGFRDMTRVASGHPAIWPGICAENRAAVGDVLDELVAELVEIRNIVAQGDHDELLSRLTEARRTRLNLPATAPEPDRLTIFNIPVPDEKGQLAKITTLASDLDVNIYDLAISHSVEGPRGVVTAVVDTDVAGAFAAALGELGYHPSHVPLP